MRILLEPPRTETVLAEDIDPNTDIVVGHIRPRGSRRPVLLTARLDPTREARLLYRWLALDEAPSTGNYYGGSSDFGWSDLADAFAEGMGILEGEFHAFKTWAEAAAWFVETEPK